MKYIDANIILRYLTRDSPAKADACYALFQRVKRGTERVTTCEAVIAEIVYVLSSKKHYALSAQEIADRLRPILELKGFSLAHKRTYLRALEVYASYPKLDFEDALITAFMERDNASELLSYDTDFDEMNLLDRIEPPKAKDAK